MTEPKIRFKRDDGSSFPDWEEKTLGEVCEPLQYGMGAAATAYDGENRYIRITDIDDSSHKYMQTDIVSPSGDLSDKYLVHNGDILLARTGASTGKSYLYNENDGKMYFAGFLIRAHVKEEYSPYFIFAQTLTEQYGKWVKQTSMRGAQPGINSTEYSMYCFDTPSLPEQQKIADFLSNVDEVIAASEEEVANLEQQKKAVMQKIFSQEVRFKKEDGSEFPDWEEKSLVEEFPFIRNGFVGTVTPYYTDKTYGVRYLQGTNIHDGIISDNEVLYVSRDFHEKHIRNELKADDIIMVQSGHVGECAVVTKKYEGCNCHALIIMSNGGKCVSEYVNYYFQSSDAKKKMDVIKTGNTVKHILASEMEKFQILIPALPEQQLIADFLTSYDEAIAAAKQELAKWKELKKGLLQQMFV